MSLTVTPDFPAVCKARTIPSFNGARRVRPFVLATTGLEEGFFPFLFAHLAFIAAEIFALAAALSFFFLGGAAAVVDEG